MKSAYTEEEIAALLTIKTMLSEEIVRMTALATTCMQHLVGCKEEGHRAEVAKRAAVSVSAMLQHLRYCSWIESELTTNRTFGDPQAILQELIDQQTEIAEAARAKLEPEPQPELLAGDTVVGEGPADAMDKLANAPSTRTKQ